MKKRIISLLVVVALVLSSNMMSFAGVVQSSNFKDDDIVEKSNRYYYKTVYSKISGEKPYKIEITEEDAESHQAFEVAMDFFLITAFSTLGAGPVFIEVSNEQLVALLSGVSSYIAFNLYESPFNSAGDYYVSRKIAKYVQVDRLTGEQRVIKRGYKIRLSHEFETIMVKVFWVK